MSFEDNICNKVHSGIEKAPLPNRQVALYIFSEPNPQTAFFASSATRKGCMIYVAPDLSVCPLCAWVAITMAVSSPFILSSLLVLLSLKNPDI